MLATTISHLLALLPQGPAHQQQDASTPPPARVLRQIPVREWTLRARRPSPPPLEAFADVMEGDEPLDLLGHERSDRRLLDPDAMLEFVRAFTPVDFDSGAVAVNVLGSTLFVSGPPDQVHLVETTTRALTAAMVHPVRLRTALFRLADERVFPVTAAPDRLAELTRGLQPLWEGTASCRAGEVVGIEVGRARSYVRDFDVEIAEESKIGDPKTRLLFEGLHLTVEPHALTESRDLVLYCQVALAEQVGPIESRSTGSAELGSIDVPAVRSVRGAFSGRIEDGGALLHAAGGDDGAGLLLAVSAAAPRTAAALDNVAVLPVSALLTKALRAPVRNTPDRPNYVALNLVLADDGAAGRLGPSDADALHNMLVEALALQDDEHLWLNGGHVVLQGREPTRTAAARLLVGLQDQSLRTAQVAVRTTMQEVGGGDGLFAEAERGAPRDLHRLSFPALLGHPHVLLRGRETTALPDVDVEIAKNSAMSNPIVETVFGGICLSLNLFPTAEGASAEVELDLLHVPPLARRSRETTDGGDLYLPQTALARLAHSGALVLGEEALLGDGPIISDGEKRYRTRQHLRVDLP